MYACGPPGMLVHSVSRGGLVISGGNTAMNGLMWPALICRRGDLAKVVMPEHRLRSGRLAGQHHQHWEGCLLELGLAVLGRKPHQHLADVVRPSDPGRSTPEACQRLAAPAEEVRCFRRPVVLDGRPLGAHAKQVRPGGIEAVGVVDP